MNKTLLVLLSLSTSLSAAEFETQQSIDGASYVYCEVGVDCVNRTIKEIDIGSDASKELVTSSSTQIALPQTTKADDQLILHFELRSSELSVEALNLIEQALHKNKFKRITVSGHTDKVGSIDYNQRLARKRAISVVNALKKLKVNQKLISVRSKCCIENPPTLNPDARKVIIQFIQ